jgi:hypothetical protein
MKMRWKNARGSALISNPGRQSDRANIPLNLRLKVIVRKT